MSYQKIGYYNGRCKHHDTCNVVKYKKFTLCSRPSFY